MDHLRFDELAASADAVYQDLAADLADIGVLAVTARVHLFSGPDDVRVAPVTQGLGRLFLDVAAGKTAPTERDAALLLSEVARLPWPDCKDQSAACTLECGAQLAFSLLDDCMRRGSCSGADVRAGITNAPKDFALGQCAEIVDVKNIDDKWPALASFVVQAYDIARPQQGTTSAAVVRNASNWVFGLLETRYCDLPAKTTAAPEDSKTCSLLKAAREVANGVSTRTRRRS
jgi:hypothetical protein